jgi:hypothetical protein
VTSRCRPDRANFTTCSQRSFAYIDHVPDPSRRQKLGLEWRRLKRRLRYTRPGDWWTAIGVICFALAIVAIGIGALWLSNR